METDRHTNLRYIVLQNLNGEEYYMLFNYHNCPPFA